MQICFVQLRTKVQQNASNFFVTCHAKRCELQTATFFQKTAPVVAKAYVCCDNNMGGGINGAFVAREVFVQNQNDNLSTTNVL